MFGLLTVLFTVFDGESFWNPCNRFSIQLLTTDLEVNFKFGVPKHSELEPNRRLAERNGDSSLSRDLRCAFAA